MGGILSGWYIEPELWFIEPELWSNQDQSEAAVEGWCILCDPQPGVSRIVRFTPMIREYMGVGIVRPFTSDLQAAEFVVARMHQGSELHVRAWVALCKAQIHGA